MKPFSLFCMLGLSMALCGCESDNGPFADGNVQADSTVMRTSPTLESVPRDDIWTWVWVDGTRCGLAPNSTGLVVNKSSTDSKGVVIFLNGGGACWNQVTCESGTLAGYLDGFFPKDWLEIEDAATEAGNFGYFDRAVQTNPFRNFDMVFVPYCTGDMHMGNAVVTYEDGKEMHHVGYRNYGIFLDLIATAFSDAGPVILAGGSAGGFGSIWNFDRTQTAFGNTPVQMYSDSGIPFGNDVLTDDLNRLWLDAFQQDQNVPPDCGDSCEDGRFDSVFRYNVEHYPENRFALDSSVADEVVRSVLSFGFQGVLPPIIPEDLFMSGLAGVAQETGEIPNVRVFYVDGTFERVGWMEWVNYRTWHVFWKTRPGNTRVQVSGSPEADLARWLGDFIQGNGDWMDFIPESMQE